MTIAFRPAEPDDAPFVVSTWSRSFKRSRTAGMIAADDWAAIMTPQIQKLLSRPTSKTLLAYENRDPTFLYGFISGDLSRHMPIVFYLYTKESYRRAGYAHGLAAALGVNLRDPFIFTCHTPILVHMTGQCRCDPPCRPRRDSAIPLAKHDPNYARYSNYEESLPWKHQQPSPR